MSDVTLGSTVELDGDLVVIGKMSRIHRASSEVREGFAQVDKGAEKTTKAMKRLGQAADGVKSAFGILKSGALSALKFAGAGVAVGLGLGALGLKEWGDYELQIARIGTLLPKGVSAMNQFGEAVARRSVQYGQSVANTADSFFQNISAGVNYKDADAVFDTIGKASVGGFTTMATATDGITNVLNAYGLSVKHAEAISDSFFVANKLGKTTFDELSSSIGNVAPVAQNVGVGYNEILAGVVSLTLAGKTTSQSMTGLTGILNKFIKPSQQGAELAEKLGIDMSVSALKSKGFAAALQEVMVKAKGNSSALATLFEDTEAIGAIMRLTSSGGLKSFNDALKDLKGSAGATDEAFQVVSNTLGFKFQQIQQGVHQWIRDIGQGLAEGLQLDKLGNIPEAVARVSKGVRAFSKEFATSFRETFQHVFKMHSLDWAGLGRTMGEMAGNVADGIAKMADKAADLLDSMGGLRAILEGINGILGGDGPAARWAKRNGIGYTDGGKLRKQIEGEVDSGTLATPELMAARAAGSKVNGLEHFSMEQKWKNGGRQEFIEQELDRRIGAINNKLQETNRIAREREITEKAVADMSDFTEKSIAGALNTAKNVEGIVSGIGGDLKGLFTNVINLFQKNETNVHGKKKGGTSSLKTVIERGGGDATLPSTTADLFLVFDGEVLDVPDEFVLRTVEP